MCPNNSMATRMAPLVEKKGEETFIGDVTKDDGTVVQEEQVREIFGARDGAIEKVDDFTVQAEPRRARHHHHPELRRLSGADRAPRLRRGRRRPDRRTRSAPGRGSSSPSRSACAPSTSGAPTAPGGATRSTAWARSISTASSSSTTAPTRRRRSPPSRPARSTPTTRRRRATSRSSTRSASCKSEAVTANTVCVRMNVTQPPFDNQKVRNAVQLAVDNAIVLDLGYQGLGRKSRENHHVGPMHPGVFRAAADRRAIRRRPRR